MKDRVWKTYRHPLDHAEPADGFVYKWVRFSVRGDLNNTNVVTHEQAGWERVPAGELPEGITEHEVGGLRLYRHLPEEIAKRTAYFASLTNAYAKGAVESYLRGADPRVPRFVEGDTRLDEIKALLEDFFYPSFRGEAAFSFKDSPGAEQGKFWTDDDRSLLDQTNWLRNEIGLKPLTVEQLRAESVEMSRGRRHSTDSPLG